MKTLKIYILIVFSSLTCVMCTEDTPDLSNVALFVSPGNDTIVSISSGDKVQYKLDISTINNHIKHLTISSFDAQFGNLTHLDSTFDKKTVSYTFIYNAPEIDRDSLNVELKFEAEDSNGNTAEVTRSLILKNRYILMEESNGIVLYGANSGMPDALSFADVSQPFVLAESPDSLTADLYVATNHDFTSFSWRSKTKTKFIRNNTFNYVAATAYSINSVYKSSVKEDVISDLKINDIILVGHENTANGVFCVKNIIRDNSVVGGTCMQLSYKGIK